MTEPLPAGWVEKVSKKKGAVYYFNAATGQSSWSRPAREPVKGPFLPEGWDEARTPEGKATVVFTLKCTLSSRGHRGVECAS